MAMLMAMAVATMAVMMVRASLPCQRSHEGGC
jgi:hypothetical protein